MKTNLPGIGELQKELADASINFGRSMVGIWGREPETVHRVVMAVLALPAADDCP
jgi:hypothetical protein